MKKNFDGMNTEESFEVLVDALYPDLEWWLHGNMCVCVYLYIYAEIH